MKELTFEEFHDRTMAIHRARRIFIDSGLMNNISKAYEIYQEVFAERERELFITTMQAGSNRGTFMDRYERPLCPECGSGLLFRIMPPGAEIKIQLVCPKADCDTVLSSDQDIAWWMAQLKKKT